MLFPLVMLSFTGSIYEKLLCISKLCFPLVHAFFFFSFFSKPQFLLLPRRFFKCTQGAEMQSLLALVPAKEGEHLLCISYPAPELAADGQVVGVGTLLC